MRKWFFIAPVLFAGFVFLMGWIVMLLWNAILVPAAHAGALSFWQGTGLLVLSRILVGGFRGGGWSRKGRGAREKWMNMTPEEKMRFKEACQNRWGRQAQGTEEEAPQGNA